MTLLVRAYNDHQLEHVDTSLRIALEGLSVEIEPCKTTPHGWVQTAFSGEDETIAQNYLTREIGLCPTMLESVDKFSTMKGWITALEDRREVSVDVGIFLPDPVTVKIPLYRLQAQLVDGRNIALAEIAGLFGFSKKLPLAIKILKVNREEKRLEAELAEKQLTTYKEWISSMLDKLIILGASSYDVEFAVKRTGFERDVLSIEPLGLFEHAVTCKLGTDAVGLIPRIGRRLRNAALTTFTPKKILGFIGHDASLLFNG